LFTFTGGFLSDELPKQMIHNPEAIISFFSFARGRSILWQKVCLIIVMLLLINGAGAQSYLKLSSKNKKALKYYHQAEESFKARENEKALIYLVKAVDKDEKFIEAWLLKGDVLTELKQYGQAINAYENATVIDSDFFPPVWYFLGELYYETGLYEKSVKALNYFVGQEGISADQKNMALEQLHIAEEALRIMSNPLEVQVTCLDTFVNSPVDEYINFVEAGNKRLIFTRKDSVGQTGRAGARYQERFYYADKHDSLWSASKIWPVRWAEELNAGGMSLTADGFEMYFTGCGWPGSFGGCDLYHSKYRAGAWQSPVNLGRAVNSSAWDSQPYVSADGRMLLFSSSRPGGLGGSDIWMSVKLKKGEWSIPVNLGDSINTPGNEMAPFLYADNQTLLFSSDGWPGLGKQDIFIARKNDAGLWSKAVNVGFPVNSKDAEINMIYSLDGKQAWLSSDRNGGSFDIFQLPVYKEIEPGKIFYFEGKVLDAKSLKPVEAKVMLTDEVTGVTLVTKNSQPEDGNFLVVLKPGLSYGFNIVASGYLFYSERITPVDSLSMAEDLNKDFLMIPVKKGNAVVLENLYFDVDSSQLKPSSYAELKKLIFFLKVNPDVKIEIAGHTDDSGDATYNMELSKLRAKSVYDYLLKKGIAPERLKYRGYGNTQPVVDNTTPAGKARNRRVVMVIL
jgi:flagellar motor protein MotB